MCDSFVFYKSYVDAANLLEATDRLEFYDAIMDYAAFEREPAINSTVVQALFTVVKPQIDANAKKRNDGKGGGRPKKTSGYENEKPVVSENENHGFENEKPVVSEIENHGYGNEKPNVNVNGNVNVNANENANVNANANVKKSGRFAPPSVEEVREYCRERGNSVDAETFVDFYQAKGWKVGKDSMKDWKACVRTWEKREGARDRPKVGPNGIAITGEKEDILDGIL